MSKERLKTRKNCGAPEVWRTCEVKPCPFCGKTETAIDGVVRHTNGNCPAWGIYSVELWDTRPIEDALTAKIAELEAALTYLRSLLAGKEQTVNELDNEIIQLQSWNSRLVYAINEIYELMHEFTYDKKLLQIKDIVYKTTGVRR